MAFGYQSTTFLLPSGSGQGPLPVDRINAGRQTDAPEWVNEVPRSTVVCKTIPLDAFAQHRYGESLKEAPATAPCIKGVPDKRDMMHSPQEIESLKRMILEWRLQENIQLPFFMVYTYVCLTTLDEEVSELASKRGKTGKFLFVLLKYGTLAQITVYFVVLTMLAVITLLVRKRYYRGRLADAVARDGGLYYFGCAALRLIYAIVTNPSIFTTEAGLSSAVQSLSIVAIPLLVQRLLLRISKVGTLGRMPPGSIASEILFASNVESPYEDHGRPIA
ncbi:hypothetical protein NMY22_g10877 [Coprinellus aureogranulatus]|nr:hypothetical protein NMY22_g10877 [Coprinellus aureogranulatus]